MRDYVHGYDQRESTRLRDQAATLTELLHHDTRYPARSRVLEAGCGVGAQTIILARRNPDASILAIDISQDSLDAAQALTEKEGIDNVTFMHRDLLDLSPEDEPFDHIFVCFVLEHVPDPQRTLVHLHTLLRPGGSITVIEGDHGSFYCHPESPEARQTVQCLIDIQARHGGYALIGRQLYPLLTAAGFSDAIVSPRMVYVDASKPDWVDGFSKKTFIAMVEGVRDQALSLGMMEETAWDQGIRDLHSATEADGVFCYTFFKAVSNKS